MLTCQLKFPPFEVDTNFLGNIISGVSGEIPPEKRKFQQDLIVQWLGNKSWNPKFRNFLLSSFNIFLPTVCKNVNLHTLRFSYNCPSSLEAVSDHLQSSELSVAAPFRNQTSVPNKHRANGFSFIPSML